MRSQAGIHPALNPSRHAHPGPFRAPLAPPPLETPLKQDLQKINPGDVSELHAMVGGLRDAADSFVTFVRTERNAGRSLGLEALASEIALVSGDEHMSRIHSALGRALDKKEAASLSEDGFSKVRRLEALLGDARGQLDNRLGDAVPTLGQPPASCPASNLLVPLIVGAIGIGAVGIFAWLMLKR